MNAEEIKKLQEEIKKNEKKLADQNRYITELENKKTGTSEDDRLVQSYVQKKLKEEAIEEAFEMLKEEVDPKIVKLLFPEVKAFMFDDSGKKPATKEYVLDVFSLLYGRASRNKEHELYKIINSKDKEDNKNNKDGIKEVMSKVNDTKDSEDEAAPTMSDEDNPTRTSGLPDQEKPQVKTTKDALKGLKDRLRGLN